MNRTLPYLMAFLLTACGIQSGSTQMNSPMTVRTDISVLSQRITLPENVKTANWIVLPLGSIDNNIPGPTDTILYAYLTFNNHFPSFQALSTTTTHTPKLPENIAQQIFPNTVLKKLTLENDLIQVQGTQYNPNFFNKGAYRGIYAVKVDDGLLICLQTF